MTALVSASLIALTIVGATAMFLASGRTASAQQGADFTSVAEVTGGEYQITSDYATESSWLRTFDVDVVGLGELSAGADRTTWSIDVVTPGFYRLRQGDLFLTRTEDDSGPGRFVSLQPLRNEQRTQLWRIEPGTPSEIEPDSPTHRIVSAWGRDSGVLSRDAVPQDDETYVPGDSVSVYEWADWDSQRWFIVAVEDPTASPDPEPEPETEPEPATPAPAAPEAEPGTPVAAAPDAPAFTGEHMTVTHSCIGLNGRIDVAVTNSTDATATFEVNLGDLAPRFLTLGVGATGDVTATGRADGPLDVALSVSDVELERTTVPIACDPSSGEVEILSTCLGGNGHIEVFLQNLNDAPATYEVQIATLDPRARELSVGGQDRVSVTGRSDGDWPVEVMRDGDSIESRTVTVECDSQPDPPAPVDDPTAGSDNIGSENSGAPSNAAFDNTLTPPTMNDPIVINTVDALAPYEAVWPAYDLFCEGRVYEVDLTGNDQDVVIDLRGQPALGIPLLVFGDRDVAIIGAEFDMEVQPGCEPGQLETQPEEGGPFVDNLNIHPRLPTGGALRAINPGVTWIEGVYLNMNGIESDCMIANLGNSQTPTEARTEREWIVVNSRCDAQEGASPGDLNGDGVHGDFLHFQGEGVVFAYLAFENVVHLSGANGVVAAQSLPDGSSSGSVSIRNYYFDYNPLWAEHGPNSPSGGVPLVLLVDDVSAISVDNLHYRTVTGTCTGILINIDDAPERLGDPASQCDGPEGLNLIAGTPEDPAGSPSPIDDLIFAPIDAIGARYADPLLAIE